MRLELLEDLKLVNGTWEYSLKFSDNPYTTLYSNIDICECQKAQAIMDKRILDFFSKKTNRLITSDLNFQYVKL